MALPRAKQEGAVSRKLGWAREAKSASPTLLARLKAQLEQCGCWQIPSFCVVFPKELPVFLTRYLRIPQSKPPRSGLQNSQTSWAVFYERHQGTGHNANRGGLNPISGWETCHVMRVKQPWELISRRCCFMLLMGSM